MMNPPATKPPNFLQLMVATQGSLGLVNLMGTQVQALEIHRGAGLYYGITWDHDRYYIIARGAVTNLLSIAKGVTGLGEVTDMPAPITRAANEKANGAHQIHYNGRLWIADTLKDRLCVYDPARQLWENPIEWASPAINRHINSIWGTRSALWVVEHTKEAKSKFVWQFRPDPFDKGKVVPFMRLQIRLPELARGPLQSGLHNIYYENPTHHEEGTLYSLGPAHLVIIEETEAWAEPLEGVTPDVHYLRGLARVIDPWVDDMDYFIIGRSNANPRIERGHGSSAIMLYNRNWRLLAEYKLPASWGQIMEIRGLTHTDKAHNGMTPPHLRQGQKWGLRAWQITTF